MTTKKPVNIFVKFADREGMKTLCGLVVAYSDLESGHLRGKKAAELIEIRSKRHATQLRQGRVWLEANHYMTDGKLGGKAYRAAAARIEKNKLFKVGKIKAQAVAA